MLPPALPRALNGPYHVRVKITPLFPACVGILLVVGCAPRAASTGTNGAVASHASEPPAEHFLSAGDPAPPLELKTLEDQPLRLADWRGKYVVVDFWATWCAPCVAEVPNLKSVYDAYGSDSRFAMMSVSLDAGPTPVRAFVARHEMRWTQGFLGGAKRQEVATQWDIVGIPSVFLIAPDGRVIARGLRGGDLMRLLHDQLGPPRPAGATRG